MTLWMIVSLSAATIAACPLISQTQTPLPAFEVATIKPDDTDQESGDFKNGRLILRGAPLRRLIGAADTPGGTIQAESSQRASGTLRLPVTTTMTMFAEALRRNGTGIEVPVVDETGLHRMLASKVAGKCNCAAGCCIILKVIGTPAMISNLISLQY